jgi:hypothetical protein
MTARARKASGGMSATATAPNAAPSSAYPTGHNGATDPLGPRFLNWEEWFQNAGISQRAEMLALSARQGLLYANQVPPPASGVKTNPPMESQCHVDALARLLTGKAKDLAPVVIKPIHFIDQQLDPAQREAVSRALFTPDVFLLQGLPGTGRSRVVAEILNQAALRGQRALFLANHPASLDAVLLRLAGSQTALPLRFLGPGETSATLPADLLPLTPGQRQQAFKEQVLQNAITARAQAHERAARRQAEAACWAHLPQLADQLAEARRRLQDCGERLAKLQGDVHGQAMAAMAPGPCAAAIAQLERDHLAALEPLNKAHDDHKNHHAAAALEFTDVESAIEALRPLADAKLAGRWWSLAWWRAIFRGQVPARLAELVGRRQALETTLQECSRNQIENRDRCQRLHDQFQVARAQLLDAEIERRRQEELEQQKALRLELQELNEHWQQQVAILELSAHRPTDDTR